MLRTTIIAALALTATPAVAAERPLTPPSVRVQTADLDLSGKAGVAALDRRIRAAVRTVCNHRALDLWELMAYRACVRSAYESAEQSRDAVIARHRPIAAEVASNTR